MTVSALIEPAALAARLPDDNPVIFDASWHMPAAARTGRAEYEAACIPGALFFCIAMTIAARSVSGQTCNAMITGSPLALR